MRKLSLNVCTGFSFENTSEMNNTNTNSINDENTNRTTTNETIVPNPGRVSPIGTKKRTLSKIFSVFSNRSNSMSISSNTEPQSAPPVQSEPPTQRTASMSGKEPVRRVPSVVSLSFELVYANAFS